ncbi:3566_t:CDS:1, partial [Ambispora leptoticha]
MSQKKSNSKYEFPRGDLAASFDDEWEQYLVALKSHILQPIGIDVNMLPKNIYPNIRVAMKDIEILTP